MSKNTKAPEPNRAAPAPSSLSRAAWLRSVHGEAIRVGRARHVSWDAIESAALTCWGRGDRGQAASAGGAAGRGETREIRHGAHKRRD